MPNSPKPGDAAASSEVRDFVEFLQIRTISSEGPLGSYRECAQWLVKFCKRRLGEKHIAKLEVKEFHKQKPLVLVKIKGFNNQLH